MREGKSEGEGKEERVRETGRKKERGIWRGRKKQKEIE
jgi:hypothetical protein